MVEMDDDFGGNVDLGRGPALASGLGVPIEARLRSLAIGILYEACRVQKFDAQDLLMFDDTFIERLFDLVELTRNVDDESLNYSVIKLIVALNEQYMVAAMPVPAIDSQSGKRKKERKQGSNKILDVLLRRVHSSKTFGENLIFMLNRANDTEEDLVMQLLLLKILYLLFTTPGTQNYFYTNDLRVLVDVFLRELVDLPEESEALRHTYLRVLNPLLNNTQLKEMPYKGPLIRRTLQGLISPNNIREVTPTTRRLVERCLNAEWCQALPAETEAVLPSTAKSNLPAHINVVSMSFTNSHSHSSVHLPSTSLSEEFVLEPPQPAFRFKTLQKSLSAEVLAASSVGVQSSEVTNDEPSPLKNESRPSPLRQPSTAKPSPLGEARKPLSNGVGLNGTKSPSLVFSSGDEAEPSMAVHQTQLPPANGAKANGSSSIHSARRPSLGNADIPRARKPPPPVPTLDRASLDSKRPPRMAEPAPLVHRREPPAIPSKSKKPKSKGNISDSPLSKLAYSATTVAR
ncbi:related to Orc3p [Serendipita indica DSM 11827]|uniref:Related to Orc3p n=1 Tax=Serendipita indica (strain DSM 11827) TaxID=1109443 RepID=G4TU80_SERID|nr:related to Orc3p [Serendipita indica DSM 11827]